MSELLALMAVFRSEASARHVTTRHDTSTHTYTFSAAPRYPPSVSWLASRCSPGPGPAQAELRRVGRNVRIESVPSGQSTALRNPSNSWLRSWRYTWRAQRKNCIDAFDPTQGKTKYLQAIYEVPNSGPTLSLRLPCTRCKEAALDVHPFLVHCRFDTTTSTSDRLTLQPV